MADDETNDQETGDDVEETDEAGPADGDLEADSESPSGDGDAAGDAADGDEKDTPGTKRSKTDDEEDDEEDLVDDDDVEADLDRILKDRMVTAEQEAEEEAGEPDDRSEGGDRLQPKQQDEQLCSACFLLVRSNAPNCPVGDDDCPIFS